MELAEFSQFEGGQYLQSASRLVFRAMKYSIKDIVGLEDAVTGEPYKLEFDEKGNLTDACVNDVLNLELSEKLVISCMLFMKGIPTEITDPRTGVKLEGVEVLPPEAGLKKNSPEVSSAP